MPNAKRLPSGNWQVMSSKQRPHISPTASDGPLRLLVLNISVSMIYGTRMSSPRQKIYNFFCSFSGSFIAAHSCFKWVFTVILPFRIP